MERFVGKIAIVTGAAAGIGECISKTLISKNMIVIGLDIDFEKLKKLALEINSKSNAGKFYPIKCDMANENDIKKTFSYVNETIGAPSILVNNAAIAIDKKIEDITGTDIDLVFATNSTGLLLAAKEAIKLMNENSIAGHILNMNSIGGIYLFSSEYHMTYMAAKHASRIFSEILRRANTEKKMNIKISNISPGVVRTKMTEDSFDMSILNNPLTCIKCEDVADACIAILDTPPNVLISELTIMPIHQNTTKPVS